MKDKMVTEESDVQKFVKMVEDKGALPEAGIKALKSLILADRAVSLEEANLLFHIKNNYPEIAASAEFIKIFIGAIVSFLLYTGETPGSLDSKEFIWLTDNISSDGEYDQTEEALLKAILDRAEKLPINFHQLCDNFAG